MASSPLRRVIPDRKMKQAGCRTKRSREDGGCTWESKIRTASREYLGSCLRARPALKSAVVILCLLIQRSTWPDNRFSSRKIFTPVGDLVCEPVQREHHGSIPGSSSDTRPQSLRCSSPRPEIRESGRRRCGFRALVDCLQDAPRHSQSKFPYHQAYVGCFREFKEHRLMKVSKTSSLSSSGAAVLEAAAHEKKTEQTKNRATESNIRPPGARLIEGRRYQSVRTINI
jgi:hypothetical protein